MAKQPETKHVQMAKGVLGVYLPVLSAGKVAMTKIRDYEPRDVVFGDPALFNAAGTDRVLGALEAGLIVEVPRRDTTAMTEEAAKDGG